MSEEMERPKRGDGEAMPLAHDLMHSVGEIAEDYYGRAPDEKSAIRNRRKIYHLIEKHGFPAFKVGGAITARRSTVRKWIEAQERGGAA